MKTITISTENSETYSSISNFFIDYYMTEANGEFVKVYLYLVRLLSNNTPVSVASIADHFNLTENDICRAIKYWISRDVLKLNYDGAGNLSGIVLLPLTPPGKELKLPVDAVSILRADRPKPSSGQEQAKVTSIEAYTEDIHSDAAELTAPAKPRFTKSYLEAKLQDDDLSNIMYQVETLFAKSLSPSDTNTILYIYDTLNFDVDLFEYLIEYCVTMGKRNCRYMEAVAIAWYKDGIKTKQEARTRCTATNGIAKLVFKALCIRRSIPTNIELAYINTWSTDYGFSPELIRLACEKAIAQKPDSANFSYVNGILENWNRANVRSVEDVEKLDREFMSKQSKAKSTPANVSSFNNFKQTRMDDALDEMEQLFIKEVNS